MYAHMHVKLLQSCPTLCNPMDPMDCSLQGSSGHGTLQARILEWIAMASSKGSSQSRNRTCVSCGSCTAGGLFISEPLGKPHIYVCVYVYIYIHVYMYTHTYIYTHIYTYTGILLNHRLKEILPFTTTWMHLESTMLSELNQT